MSGPSRQLSSLAITTDVRAGRAVTHCLVDGVDILDLERPTHFRTGELRSEPAQFHPPDPVGLLPPDSRVLLPSEQPCPAMIGICSCGLPDDASLWLQVRRDGDTVLWESEPLVWHDSIQRTYRFELLGYLDAIDRGARTVKAWEDRSRRLARELRRRRDRWCETPACAAHRPEIPTLINASARPDVDELYVRVATGFGFVRYPVPNDLDDEQVPASIGTRVRHENAMHEHSQPLAP